MQPDRVWFYEIRENEGKKLREKEYMGTLSQIELNDEYAAVVAGNKVRPFFICPLIANIITRSD